MELERANEQLQQLGVDVKLKLWVVPAAGHQEVPCLGINSVNRDPRDLFVLLCFCFLRDKLNKHLRVKTQNSCSFVRRYQTIWPRWCMEVSDGIIS